MLEMRLESNNRDLTIMPAKKLRRSDLRVCCSHRQKFKFQDSYVMGIFSDTGATASHPIRLPETVRPLHYKLTFDPKIYGKDESDFSSEGRYN